MLQQRQLEPLPHFQQLLQQLQSVRGPPRQLIHPEGPLGALQYAQYVIGGSDTMFKDLFRLTKPEFHSLLDWLKHHGLVETQYQMTALKPMIFLWILAYEEPQRNTSHHFLCAQSSVCSIR